MIEWKKILPVGEDSAISMDELTRRLNYRNSRETRTAVTIARLSGVAVCSNSNGYFLADYKKPDEVLHTIRAFGMRAFTSLRIASRLSKWLEAHGGCGFSDQITIKEFIEGGNDGN